ncbi:glycosyl hydrolase family 65 protein, partial [Atopococcus tabaci]|uniref:glycosyl hydrolase family 65 protein n=1 Tax=Atopococcus tabaci TaxID=269774 RepID=UPI0024095085
MKNVIGPDEYTEFVDNNAYTNYMAYYNVQSALQFIDEDDSLRFEAEAFLDRLYLPSPNREGILPQDDTFLTLPELDIRRYKESAGKQLILTEFSREEVNERQVLKQADVVMLLYVLPELFDEKTTKKNLDYYEARTIHDSSLSKCIHSIVCLRNGEREKGEQFFEEELDIDFDSAPTTSLDGVHAGSLGGMWLMIAEGFAGITEEGGTLLLRPVLPSVWEEYSFPYVYRGRRLHITI